MARFGTRRIGRDRGLTLRMYLTFALLGALYAAFVVFLLALDFPVWFVAIIAGLMLGIQFFLSDRLVLWSTGAKKVTREQEPEFHAMVERLVAQAEMPMPTLAVMNSPVPNAFATGRSPKKALVAITTGIRARLSDRELEAVLGHELAHVKNRDMAVLTIASFFVTMASFILNMLFWRMLFGGFGGLGGQRDARAALAMFLLFIGTIVFYFVAQLLVLALTRYREYSADHGGANLTGDPGGLASALEKISGSMARIPQEDLRKMGSANAFLIIPALRGGTMQRLFSTHPPPEERIRRLREMERQMRFGGR